MVQNVVAQKVVGGFDDVGQYDQDKINGFTPELLNDFIEHTDIRPNSKVLDFMAGNGNLTSRVIDFYPKQTKTVEFHCVDIAGEQLNHSGLEQREEYNVTLHAADAIEGMPFFENNYFDRVMRKSASHEILLPNHVLALKGVYRVLDNKGYFTDMGFLFQNEKERNEFRELARKKDSLANLDYLVENRHFLTKDEMYTIYQQAGFRKEKISIEQHFNYNVDSSILCEAYLKDKFPQYEMMRQEFDDYCIDNLTTLVEKGVLRRDENRIWIKAPAAMIVAEK